MLPSGLTCRYSPDKEKRDGPFHRQIAVESVLDRLERANRPMPHFRRREDALPLLPRAHHAPATRYIVPSLRRLPQTPLQPAEATWLYLQHGRKRT